MQKYGKFGEAQVPRSRTRLEDAALQNLPHTSTLRGCEASGKMLKQKNRYEKQNAKALGSKAEEPKTPRAKSLAVAKKRTRTRYVRNPTRARGVDIVAHPLGATSKPGGELPGKFPQEN